MIKKRIIIALISATIILCSGCQSKNEQSCEKAYKAYHKGLSLVKKNKYDDALKQFNIAIDSNIVEFKFTDKEKKKIDIKMLTNQYIESLYYKATLLEKKGDEKLLVAAYKKALKEDYKYTKTQDIKDLTLLNRMNAHVKLKDYDKALEDIEKAKNVWAKKTKEIFMYNKIMIYEKENDWQNAKAACEEYKAVFGEDKIKDDSTFLNTR